MSNEKMSIWGVGIKFAIISIIYLAITIFVSMHTKPLFMIKQLPQQIADIIGIVFLCIGIPFYRACGRTVHRIYKENKLFTAGIYATCRHSLHASFIFFNAPVIVVFFRFWLMLTVPLFMCVLLIILAKKEEGYLIATYGNEYIEYKRNTNFAFLKT